MFSVKVPKHNTPKQVLFLRRVPAEVKALFKSTCYRRGDDMQSVMIALMKKYVADPKCVRVQKRKKRAVA